jgi:hypothetical protein
MAWQFQSVFGHNQVKIGGDYTPNLGYTIRGTVNLHDTDWLFPRCSTDSPANSTGPAYYDVKYTSSTTTCTCLQHLQYKTC